MENSKPNPNKVDHINFPSVIETVRDDMAQIKAKFDAFLKTFEPKQSDELLTRNEVKNILKCDLSTVHNLTVKKKLKKYGIGNRVYYKRSEVEAAIKPL